MKDYGQTDKVIIGIITFDSESCTPCQYMVEAVKKVTPQFDGIVEWREHRIKEMESVTFVASLMVRNIPTICIDSKIAFVSKIPPRNELVQAIQKRINEKLKLKIQAKKAEIIILGGDYECQEINSRVIQAIRELGKDIEIKQVSGEEEIKNFGIIQTPGMVISEYKVKLQGEIPSIDLVKEWLKEL